jgi:hypothetical protein
VEYHLNKLRCLATHHVGIVDLALIARTQSIERSAKLPENRGFRLHESRFQHEISLKLTVPPPVVPGTKSGFDG